MASPVIPFFIHIHNSKLVFPPSFFACFKNYCYFCNNSGKNLKKQKESINYEEAIHIVDCFLVASVQAQDVIVKKDGSTILSKVLEVNQDNVRYKKHSNPTGPTYTVSISDIMAVNYANGEKDTFDVQQSNNDNLSSQNNSEPRFIEKKPDARNAEIINMYKTNCTPTKEIERSK